MVKICRKRPVLIEAVQFIDTPESIYELSKFITGQEIKVNRHDIPKPMLIIKTLEGEHIANEGDYIIKGVRGEYYPCKRDIFEQTYEVVANQYVPNPTI